MDTQSAETNCPLYVDLDGTLIATDLLTESFLHAVRRDPLALARVPGWLSQGKARLKRELAERANLDPALLPYRPDVLAMIERARASGRRVVLATGADRRYAEAVASHLGLFDAVVASDGTTNMTARRKLDWIRADCGPGGFDYLGNSHEDVEVFEAAREASVVSPDRAAGRWQRANQAPLLGVGDRTRHAAVQVLRPHQWTKNLLLFVPLVLGLDFLTPGAVPAIAFAFVSFCLAASSIYVINDLLDIESDRRHKTKRSRPFAAGTLNIRTGVALSAGCLLASLAIAAFLPIEFLGVLAVYLLTTTAYSIALKRMLLIDVFALAGLYMLRILAGEAAAGLAPSFWLLAFSLFFFMSLALVKRYTELVDQGPTASRQTTGRGYVAADLETLSQAGMTSGFVSVLVLALYITSDAIRESYDAYYFIWPLCPLVLYIIVRIWVLARRHEMHDDPVIFLLRDWRSQLMIGIGAVMFVLAAVA